MSTSLRSPGRGVGPRHVAAASRAHRYLMVEELSGSALLQDLGRAHLSSGVPVGGAFDRRAHRLALALVGSPSSEATLEVWGSITLRAGTRVLVALTGDASAHLQRRGDGSAGWDAVPAWTALELAAGDALRVTATGRGYLAARGGLPGLAVLGSRSTCLLGPLGPAPVARGDALGIGDTVSADARPGEYVRPLPRGGTHAVVVGPHLSMDLGEAQVLEASRIGVRLRPQGVEVTVGVRADLPSLGVLPGTIQVLPSGDWVVLGPDAGTMGGYPIVGVLAGDGLDRWAHLQPGARVTMIGVEPGTVQVPPLETVIRVGEIG